MLRTYMILSILSSLFYENTCVLLLDLLTTVCSMFMKDFLALFYLTVLLKSNRKTLLVWGGFTSVRSNAIQLDVAFSHKVITTASLKNFEYVQRLSVIQVFNYNSLTVVKDIIEAFCDWESADVFAIDNGSMKPCLNILSVSQDKKFVAQASVTLFDKFSSSSLEYISFEMFMKWDNMFTTLKFRMKHIDKKFIFDSNLMVNKVSCAIYKDFLLTVLT